VRNYLDEAVGTLGLRLRRERGDDRAVRVVVEPATAAATIEQLAHALAHEMLRRVFPVEGTAFGSRGPARNPQLVVSVRGTYNYDEAHLRVVRRWLQGASGDRRAVRFAYGSDRRERVVWPIGMVVRDLARVYLAGVPANADDGSDVHTYALERFRSPVAWAAGDVSPPAGLEGARILDGIDDPFSVFPPSHNGAMVHVRFTPEEARYVVNRAWHRTQKWKRRRDGSVDLMFGPADLDEAAAWVRQWGPGVRVIGDERTLAAVRKA